LNEAITPPSLLIPYAISPGTVAELLAGDPTASAAEAASSAAAASPFLIHAFTDFHPSGFDVLAIASPYILPRGTAAGLREMCENTPGPGEINLSYPVKPNAVAVGRLPR
jgi:hypothetical protein